MQKLSGPVRRLQQTRGQNREQMGRESQMQRPQIARGGGAEGMCLREFPGGGSKQVRCGAQSQDEGYDSDLYRRGIPTGGNVDQE